MAARRKKWSGSVVTHSNLPEGLFTKSATTIANTLERRSHSCAQAISRLNFYINRAGSNLSAKDRTRLDAAKLILEHRCLSGR
jgi:hypothetical protein